MPDESADLRFSLLRQVILRKPFVLYPRTLLRGSDEHLYVLCGATFKFEMRPATEKDLVAFGDLRTLVCRSVRKRENSGFDIWYATGRSHPTTPLATLFYAYFYTQDGERRTSWKMTHSERSMARSVAQSMADAWSMVMADVALWEQDGLAPVEDRSHA